MDDPQWMVVTIKKENWLTRWWLEFRILCKRAGGGKPQVYYRSRDWPHDSYGVGNSSALGKAWHPAHLTLAFRPMRGFRRHISRMRLNEEQLAQIQEYLEAVSHLMGYEVLLVRVEDESLYRDLKPNDHP